MWGGRERDYVRLKLYLLFRWLKNILEIKECFFKKKKDVSAQYDTYNSAWWLRVIQLNGLRIAELNMKMAVWIKQCACIQLPGILNMLPTYQLSSLLIPLEETHLLPDKYFLYYFLIMIPRGWGEARWSSKKFLELLSSPQLVCSEHP